VDIPNFAGQPCWVVLRATVGVLPEVLGAPRGRIPEQRGTPQLDFRREIAEQVKALPPEMQERVLRFRGFFGRSAPKGERGAALRQFSFSLDAVSARQMAQAIEEGCERVDAGEWCFCWTPTSSSPCCRDTARAELEPRRRSRQR
jgi:hypothetical protein